ncbi:hypothetical protein [Klebsiella pneumoniae]|uniref:hypothetical protein n=1 Tax=Klebsiella pneumoniae TaxID=573 RepID=UPI00272F2117|nr:hypothetical protein [Klebsiella pneumoniae]
MKRGRKRQHNPNIPGHIDQAALPRSVYFAPFTLPMKLAPAQLAKHLKAMIQSDDSQD